MRTRRALWTAGLAAAVVALALLFWGPAPSPPGAERSLASASSSSPVRTQASLPPNSSSTPEANQVPPDPHRSTALPQTPDGFVVWSGAATATQEINRPDQSAREDMQAVKTTIDDYRSVFGEVPLGGLNEEITRGLRGDNPKKIIFLTSKADILSPVGELLDRWGTPYFFHKLSRDTIDLRSAGPDRKLWTKDDIFEKSSGAPPL